MDPQGATRRETVVAGIAGVSLGQIERTVPADEAPPLAPNADLTQIGKSVPRWNGRQKVTGAVRFTADINLPGLLHARLLRSPLPHARIRAIETGAAERHPGVRAVQVLLGPAGGGTASVSAEEGVEATRRVEQPIALYAGVAVAAVAAISPQAADAALRLIKVDYAPLPFVVDMDDARAPHAPVVFEKLDVQAGFGASGPVAAGLPLVGNVRGPTTDARGDVAAGWTAAEVVVEADYRTQVQSHCCLEPHGIVADWRADGLTVYISTQFTAGVREELARAFGLPLSRARVIVDAMGGGFGSKSTLGYYGRAAVALSRQAGAPVRLVFDRQEEQVDSGYRPATWQRLRIGARRDGTLTAISLLSYGTAGTALGAGVGNVASRMYTCPNFEESHYDVFTNAGAGSAMRAPGAVPGAFALEQAVDELAEKLGMDPIALRDRIDPSPARREERRIGAKRIGWSHRHAPGAETGPIKTGLGVGQSLWGANVQVNSTCEVRVMRDGSVEVRSSVQDIGTGIGTVLAQVVAEELGLKPEDVVVRIGDTDFPAGPPSHGSRTTASITPPARNAAYRVCQRLFALAAPVLGVAADDLQARDGRIVSRADPARAIAFRDAAAKMRTEQIVVQASRADDYDGFRARMGDAALAQNDLGGVHFAAVSVDTETGLVRVERVVAAQDCGRPMNPRQIESQVQGGVLQGLGYALLEERVFDRQTGHIVNANLEQYKLPGAFEVPSIDVVTIENYQGFSSTDAYGVAEPATIATAPAIANAIYNAIGVRLRALPMNRSAILAALAAGEDLMSMPRFEWSSARTVAEAAAASSATVADAMLAAPAGASPAQAAVFQAGGIDVLDLMKENLLAPRRVVSVRGVAGLDRIAEDGRGGVRIGALATLEQVATHPLVVRRYAALADALAGSASPQIRHIATLGGNILQRPRCWYFRSELHRCLRKGGGRCFAIHGENQYHAVFSNEVCAVVHPSTAATALVAFDASVEIANAQGELRRPLLDEFFVAPEIDVQRENDLKPGEVATAVLLPPLAAGATSAHLRESDKLSFDWPIADVAVVLERDADGRCRGAAVVLGAAAPVPYRARAAEELLVGKAIDEAVARAAGQAALEGATPLARNHYKLPIFAVLVRRALLRAAGQA